MKTTLKELEERVLVLEKTARFQKPEEIDHYFGMVNETYREVQRLGASETGRIRHEVTKMFKQVMTERDLFQLRIPWYKFTTRKIKNAK